MGIQVACRIIIPCKALCAVLRYRSRVAIFVMCIIGIVSITVCYSLELSAVIRSIGVCAEYLRADFRLCNITEVVIDQQVTKPVMGYGIQAILVVGIVVLYSLTVLKCLRNRCHGVGIGIVSVVGYIALFVSVRCQCALGIIINIRFGSPILVGSS